MAERTDFDLEQCGLKIGLEIHQQVGKRKLFCGCPAQIVERAPDLVVGRKLRASAGETGAIDVAAQAEAAKQKLYSYHAYHGATCLVELDEEPPHPADTEVIRTGAMVAKACGSTILPTMQFMRKTIVDGSATSGFQRTGLLALGGQVPQVQPPVRLQTICVEEDAAKIVERSAGADTYNLSRLGIPLIEIATEPDIVSPQHAQETAAQLGMLLRSTRRVKRGLGTIRQDLNVSIAGGTRIEIKGAQDLRMIPVLLENEARRQHNLLRLKGDLQGADPLRIAAHPVDVTGLLRSGKGFIAKAIERGEKAFGMKVAGFHGLLGRELCPNYRVGTELADLAKSWGFGGLIHSDEDMAKYGLAERLADLRAAFGLAQQDAFIILIGDPARIRLLMESVLVPRIRQFFAGVPKEVRRANPDGTTSFLRPMPGGARMYPETDIPLVAVPADVEAPMLLTEQARLLKERFGLGEEQARLLVREGIDLEEQALRYPSIDPVFIATASLTYGKEIQARYGREIDHLALLDPLLAAVQESRIPKEAVFQILVEIAEGKTSPDAIDYGKYAQLPDDELRGIVREVLAANPQARPNALMGQIMAKARGKADGKRVMEMLKEEQR